MSDEEVYEDMRQIYADENYGFNSIGNKDAPQMLKEEGMAANPIQAEILKLRVLGKSIGKTIVTQNMLKQLKYMEMADVMHGRKSAELNALRSIKIDPNFETVLRYKSGKGDNYELYKYSVAASRQSENEFNTTF